MEKTNKGSHKFMSRVWVKEVDQDRYIEDDNGNRAFVFSDWKESLDDVSLGSINNPNPNLLEIRFICKEIKDQDDEMIFKNSGNIFRRFFS